MNPAVKQMIITTMLRLDQAGVTVPEPDDSQSAWVSYEFQTRINCNVPVTSSSYFYEVLDELGINYDGAHVVPISSVYSVIVDATYPLAYDSRKKQLVVDSSMPYSPKDGLWPILFASKTDAEQAADKLKRDGHWAEALPMIDVWFFFNRIIKDSVKCMLRSDNQPMVLGGYTSFEV